MTQANKKSLKRNIILSIIYSLIPALLDFWGGRNISTVLETFILVFILMIVVLTCITLLFKN